MNRCDRGRRAEQDAARYLAGEGYRILRTNWRWGKKELDLVAIYRGELVIVEVKSSFGNRVNDPSEVVDRIKQRRIILAAEAFIRTHHLSHPTRFDVIAVIYHSRGVDFDHTENAFIPGVE